METHLTNEETEKSQKSHRTFFEKGQCHQIFCVGFFHQKAAPGPIKGTLGQFKFLAKIHRDNGQKVGSVERQLGGVSYKVEW